MRRFLPRFSIRWQIFLALMLVASASTSLLGWRSYVRARGLISDEAAKVVSVAADAREKALERLLRRRQDRAASVLRRLPAVCGLSPAEGCTRAALRELVTADGALAVELVKEGLREGDPSLLPTRPPNFQSGQLAVFARFPPERRVYMTKTGDGKADGEAILAVYGAEDVDAIFEDRYGLGESGESFLTDAQGYFLTPARHATHMHRSHPIDTLPMRRCLAADDGASLALDYRGVPIIHGYRHVPAVGGGCIMAHIDQAEAFASIQALRDETLAAYVALTLLSAGLAWWFSRFLARPIRRLRIRAVALASGDLASPVPVSGPAEIRDFAETFAVMAERLRLSDIERLRLLDSERARRHQAEVGSQSKSTFLALMSHEIRTPLNAVLGFAELLRDPETPASERGLYVETIIRNGQSLRRLIDDILDLSKVEADKLTIERLDVSIKSLVQEVVALFSRQEREKGLAIKVEVQPDVPDMVWTDPARLRQIITNILGNAVKFSDAGEIRITVAYQRPRLIISVADQGLGMTAEQQERIFKPFAQADLSTSQKYGGTGLGLVLSRRLARALGGDLILQECRPGNGCTFVITVNAERVSEEPGEHVRSEALPSPVGTQRRAVPDGSLEGLRVLLADDVPDNQLLVRTILQRYGVKVDVAGDGLEAVEKATFGQYDMILMDVQMPRLDGYEATRALRRQGYTKPIIALTARALTGERQTALDAGCSAHLAKPVRPEALLAAVRSASQLVH